MAPDLEMICALFASGANPIANWKQLGQLAGLKQDGVIKRIGPDKGGYWEIAIRAKIMNQRRAHAMRPYTKPTLHRLRQDSLAAEWA